MSRHRQLTPSPRNDTLGTAALLPSGYPNFDGSQPCASVDDRDVFFPTLGNEQAASRATKRICRGCTFQQPCAEWALDNNELGVWGGLTERERNAIRRQSERKAS